MNAKNVRSVFIVLTLLSPSVTHTASVNRYVSSGSFGSAYATSFDGCTYNNFYVHVSETTFKGRGTRQETVHSAQVDIYTFNSCTEESAYWYGASESITFAHMPATHGSFPQSVAMSGDVTLTNLVTEENGTIHIELQLASAGDRIEYVHSSHYEYSFDGQIVKVDDDSKGHQSNATGSLDISGDFEFANASISGSVGVSTFRTHTVLHH